MIFHLRMRKCRKDFHAAISRLWLEKQKGSQTADRACIFHQLAKVFPQLGLASNLANEMHSKFQRVHLIESLIISGKSGNFLCKITKEKS